MKLSTKAGILAVFAGAGLLAPAIAAPPAVAILAIGSQPDTDAPTMQQAGALFQQQNFAEAAKLYEKITEAQPENAQAWFQMGYCFHVTGSLEKAIPAHKKAASLAPDGSQFKVLGLYNLGCAYALQGKSDAAFGALMKAVDAGFHTDDNAETARTDSDLDSLRDDARFAKFSGLMRFENRSSTLKQFDFWVGNWDVYNAEGSLVGKNVINIKPFEGGLILMEHWTSAGGGSGRSMNYYEPVSRRWKQIWVDSKGVLETSGVWKDGSLRFRGERKTNKGQVIQHKMVFTPDDHGNVRQLIHESSDGENWEEYFDGLYVPAGSDSPGAWRSNSRSEADSHADAKPAAPAHGALAGAWDMVVEQTEGDAIDLRLMFTWVDGTLEGVADAMGAQMTLEEITLKGGELTMTLMAPDGLKYQFEGVVKGSTIKGTWADEEGDKVDASATRADI